MINYLLNRFNLRVSKIYPRGFQRYALRGKKNLFGAEVGVYRRKHALSLLTRSDVKKIYLIDSYKPYKDYGFYGKNKLLMAKKEAFETLSKYNVVYLYESSDNAINKIKEKLDFVYIDGNHAYNYVKKDIENYWKVLKDGGILADDDVTNVGMENSPNRAFNSKERPCDVLKAVCEFAIKNNLRVNVAENDWWIVKGELEDWNL